MEGLNFHGSKARNHASDLKCVPFSLERISRIVAEIHKKAEIYLNEEVIAIAVLFVIGENSSCLKEYSWRIGYISFGSTLLQATVCVYVCVCALQLWGGK